MRFRRTVSLLFSRVNFLQNNVNIVDTIKLPLSA
jgi:hypothetical protein